MSNTLTKDLLYELFDYKDGFLLWKYSPTQKVKVGDPAGCFTGTYSQTTINYKMYMNHRLIFLMHHGYLPKEVDHIDGNKLNNKIENLREATRCQNGRNRKVGRSNTSGYTGVCFSKELQKWRARIFYDNKNYSLGYHVTAADANDAILKFKRSMGDTFIRGETN